MSEQRVSEQEVGVAILATQLAIDNHVDTHNHRLINNLATDLLAARAEIEVIKREWESCREREQARWEAEKVLRTELAEAAARLEAQQAVIAAARRAELLSRVEDVDLEGQPRVTFELAIGEILSAIRFLDAKEPKP